MGGDVARAGGGPIAYGGSPPVLGGVLTHRNVVVECNASDRGQVVVDPRQRDSGHWDQLGNRRHQVCC